MIRRVTRRRAMSLVAATPMLFSAGTYARSRAVNESGFVPIGGIYQWITVQGHNVENPVIVYLHGGPAEAQSPLLSEFRPWEHAFTVLNWDQRGSGKTFGKYGAATPGMETPQTAFDRLTEDAIEVAKYACRRLRKRKVILVGQSWGSMLGLRVVKRRPDLFYAYVGTGFPANIQICEQARRSWVRAQAQEAHDEATLDALKATAKLSRSNMRRFMVGKRYLMSRSDLRYLNVQRNLLGQLPKVELQHWIGGAQFTTPRLLPIIGTWDPRKVGLDFELPMFVIQGRDDHVTSFKGAKDYIAAIRAPRKAFIPIAGGHYACFTDPKGFVGALRRDVWPLAVA